MKKTNAMRLLEAAGILFRTSEYEVNEDNLSGVHVAEQIRMNPDMVFKTLITRGDKSGINIFCIPVNSELNLKKASLVSGNKRIEMVLMKDILSLTGYIRGGCSPIGMKKSYPTYIDEIAVLYDEIAVSAGVRGCQIIINPNELADFVDAQIVDLI